MAVHCRVTLPDVVCSCAPDACGGAGHGHGDEPGRGDHRSAYRWYCKSTLAIEVTGRTGGTFVVPASAAVFGLVLGDAVPGRAGAPTFSGGRWALLAVVLGLLVATVAGRRWIVAQGCENLRSAGRMLAS